MWYSANVIFFYSILIQFQLQLYEIEHNLNACAATANESMTIRFQSRHETETVHCGKWFFDGLRLWTECLSLRCEACVTRAYSTTSLHFNVVLGLLVQRPVQQLIAHSNASKTDDFGAVIRFLHVSVRTDSMHGDYSCHLPGLFLASFFLRRFVCSNVSVYDIFFSFRFILNLKTAFLNSTEWLGCDRYIFFANITHNILHSFAFLAHSRLLCVSFCCLRLHWPFLFACWRSDFSTEISWRQRHNFNFKLWFSKNNRFFLAHAFISQCTRSMCKKHLLKRVFFSHNISAAHRF